MFRVSEDHDPLAFAPFTHPRRVRAALVADVLRKGRLVSDETFDEIYPEAVQKVSPAHWTPVRVCARVVELLGLGPGDRLLDIGAGAGKLCIVAAAMSRARARGVERQPQLAEVAREAARRFGVEIEVRDGTFDDEDPQSVDAVYLYNPFTETMLLPGVRELAADRFGGRALADIVAAQKFLERTRSGTRVATFWGFGGMVPFDFQRTAQETWDGGELEVWEKR